jgi:hypothetical protein
MKNKTLIVSKDFAIFALCFLLSSCVKETLDPPLASGECEFKREGYVNQSSASQGLSNAKAPLVDPLNGGYSLNIVRTKAYVAATKGRNDHEWGYQIVYSCAEAKYFSESQTYGSESERDSKYSSRLSEITNPGMVKIIKKSTDSRVECSDCGDGNYNCSPCSSYYDYTINYLKKL